MSMTPKEREGLLLLLTDAAMQNAESGKGKRLFGLIRDIEAEATIGPQEHYTTANAEVLEVSHAD